MKETKMSFSSRVIFETSLNKLNPYRDEPIDMDYLLSWYHNGAKGFHHISNRCASKNKNADLTTSQLSLTQVKSKRLCPNCFETGLLINFFNGARVFNHLAELASQYDIYKEKLTKDDLSIGQLTEIIESNEKLKLMLINPDKENHTMVQEGNQTKFNKKVLAQAQEFEEFLAQRLEHYQSKIENVMVGSYLASYAEENLDKFFKGDEINLFTPVKNNRAVSTSAINILRSFFSLRGKLTPLAEIKKFIMQEVDTIQVTDLEQLKGVPMISGISDLKSTVELSWKSYKLSILEPILERWENLYTKQLSKTTPDLVLINTSEMWRAEHLKVLFPYFKVQENTAKDLVLLKTPRFVTNWASQNSLNSSYSSRNMDRTLKVFEEKSYTASELSTALVLYDTENESVYNDFLEALTAAKNL